MPRKNLIRTSEFYYHITSRSNQQTWFNLPLFEVWKICQESLFKSLQKHPVEISNFVLMNNHYHLLIRTPHENIDQFMYELNKQISLNLRVKTNLVNRMFGGRYKRCLILSEKYFFNCYRYIYQNPIRANLVKRCEVYPYSTLFYKVNEIDFGIPLVDAMDVNIMEKLNWINQDVNEKERLSIKRAFYRTELKDLKNL